ncbi:TPA: hypothetical protein JD836_14845 [Citrobacter freundii]|nr:hypothetical protein [Citrobacter freundii]HCD1268079.1 tyrosine-type recombinase/integrase [Citrobacter freundii]
MNLKSVSDNTAVTLLPSEIDASLVEKLKLFLSQHEAFSPNTLKKIKSTFNLWSKWCKENNRQVLPVLSGDFRDYITHMYKRGLASTSIDSHKTMMNLIHRHIGLDPITADIAVTRDLSIVRRRSIMEGERTGQAIPLRMADLRQLETIWTDSSKLVQLRNLAALHMSYNTMLRISELARVRVRDLTLQSNGTMLIHVPYTKTILTASGLVKILSRHVTQIVQRWLKATSLLDHPDAYVLSPVHRTNKVIPAEKPMTHAACNAIFAQAWRDMGKEEVAPNKGRYTCWTGHSCRVGAAQDLMLSGASLAAIMHEGTWRDPKMAMQYLREIEAQNSELVKLYDGEM